MGQEKCIPNQWLTVEEVVSLFDRNLISMYEARSLLGIQEWFKLKEKKE